MSGSPPLTALRVAALRAVLWTLLRPALALPIPSRLRRGWTELLARANLVPGGIEVASCRLGGVAAERIEPRRDVERVEDDAALRRDPGVILYLHGGGYVTGSPRTERAIAAPLARASGMSTFSPAYRLAPEHPFPAALEDALAAYRSLLEGDGGRGDPRRVVVAGDSAGAGLAVALAIDAGRHDLPPPAALILLCPWLDLESNGSASHRDRDPVLPRAFLRRGARAYLDGEDPRNPLCSPLFASPDELGALPPTLVHMAAEDPLLADGERFVRSATQAGADVESRCFQLWHDFHLHAGMLRTAQLALAEAAEFATRPRSAAESAGAARREASPS